jgi:hypothetical protein
MQWLRRGSAGGVRIDAGRRSWAPDHYTKRTLVLYDLEMPIRPSYTAETVALQRSFENNEPEGRRLFSDPFARSFLHGRLRLLAQIDSYRWLKPAAERLFDFFGGPGPRPSAILRTRAIDDVVAGALKSRSAGSVRHSSSPRSATCLLSRALDPAHFRRVSKARPTAAGLRQLRGLLPYPEAAPSRDRRPGQGGAPQPLCARAFGLIRAGVAPDIDVEISWWFGEDSGSTDAFQCGCRSQTADGPPFYAQIAARRGIDTDECPVIAAH